MLTIEYDIWSMRRGTYLVVQGNPLALSKRYDKTVSVIFQCAWRKRNIQMELIPTDEVPAYKERLNANGMQEISMYDLDHAPYEH